MTEDITSSNVFKTPAKLILPNSDDEGEQDLSTIIPTKPSPSTHLPPVQTDQNPKLVVEKKRKLQLIADPDDVPDTLIPSKSRSASSVSSDSKRIPSLNLISKPTLTPPEPNKSYRTFDESTPELRRTSTPLQVHNSSPSRPERSQQSTPQSLIELRRQETKLDAEIRAAKQTLENLKRARTILNKKDSTDNEELVVKWRDAAQKASFYLLNAAIDKINRTGGKKEFVRKEKEKLKNSLEYSIDSSFQDRIHEITNSEAYETLSEKEQERILEDLEEEQEKVLEEAEKTLLENEDIDLDDEDALEFTMKDLYKRLNLDYKLVFPDEE